MFGILAAVALIATPCVHGANLGESVERMSTYSPDGRIYATFCNPDIPVRLSRNTQEEAIHENGIVFSTSVAGRPYLFPDIPVGREEDPLCGFYQGINLPAINKFGIGISSFRWVFESKQSKPGEPAIYTFFVIYFEVGPRMPLHLTIPVCPDTQNRREDTIWQIRNRVGSLSMDMVWQLQRVLDNEIHTVSFTSEWLEDLLARGVYANENPIRLDNRAATHYITRPVLVPRPMVLSFMELCSRFYFP